MQLSKALLTQGQIHERVLQLAQQLAADLNSDFAALFNEKKYRELQAVAIDSQQGLIESLQALSEPLVKLMQTAAVLSG